MPNYRIPTDKSERNTLDRAILAYLQAVDRKSKDAGAILEAIQAACTPVAEYRDQEKDVQALAKLFVNNLEGYREDWPQASDKIARDPHGILRFLGEPYMEDSSRYSQEQLDYASDLLSVHLPAYLQKLVAIAEETRGTLIVLPMG